MIITLKYFAGGGVKPEMKGFFRKIFNIYPGEEKNAFLFACLGFLWAMGITSGLKFSDALFLLHVGADSLPTAYTLSSCALIVISAFLLYAFYTFSTHRIFMTVVSIGICFYSFAYFCLMMGIGTQAEWLWFMLRVFGTVMFTVTLTCYWTFIDQYYHLQDAKRLYTLFSSMIFLGVASTGTIMQSGLIDFEHVTLIIVALLLGTMVWILKIVNQVRPVHDDNEPERSGGSTFESLSSLVKSVMGSPFTQLIMGRNFMIYLLLVITEYNYLASFDRHFDPENLPYNGDEQNARLTQFLGQCLSGVSITNLLIGLLLYSRLVRRFGITSLMLVTPVILLITFSGWQVSDSLLFPVLGIFVVEGTLYVIDDSNFNLLLNAVPSKMKYKIRVTIESLFEPAGTLLGALLITYAPIDSRMLGLFLACGMLAISVLLQRKYLKAIYLNLAENAMHFHRTIHKWFIKMSNKECEASEHRLLAILRHGDVRSQCLALEGLIALDEGSMLNKVLGMANQLETGAKMKFIELVGQGSFGDSAQVLDKLQEWSREETDPELRAAIQFYLARLGLLHPEKAAQDLDSDNLVLQGAAILSLKGSWAHLPAATVALNRTLAAQKLQQLLESSDTNHICMGLSVLGAEAVPLDIDILLPFLRHPTLQVKRAAAAALAKIADKTVIRYAGQLISLLAAASDNEFRLSCLKALGKMGDSSIVKDLIANSIHFRPSERRATETLISKMGLRTVPTLLAITKETGMPDPCRVLAGRVLGHLAMPQLRANLYGIMSHEIERAHFYFYYWHTIQKRYPEYDLQVLADALLTGYHSVLDFIIQLLSVAGEIEDCELLSRSLRSRNPKVRSQVVEALEKSCETGIFRILRPLVSDLPTEEKLHAYELRTTQPLSLSELLNTMSQSSSQVDQIIAAALRHKLNMPEWRESLRKQMGSNEEIFHHFAYELLET